MTVLRGSWTEWSVAGTAVAVGVFDGVHRGHLAVLREVVEGHGTPTVLTFDPHPVAVVAPEHAPPVLTSVERRIELFGEAGIEVTAVLRFDEQVRAMSPEAFVLEVLVGGLGAERVVVGADFHFGKDRAGSPAVLADIGARLGIEVTVMPLVGDGDGISSSAIRAAIAAGDVEAAAVMLGRLFRVAGTVVAGDGRGAAIGFPTANLDVAADAAVPRRGVYAVLGVIDGDRLPGVANVGVRPTFGGGRGEVVEIHLLDVDRDLYGRHVGVDFVSRIRDEMAFDDVEALVAQISADVEEARRIHTS